MKNSATIVGLALALSAFAGLDAFAGTYLASAHRTIPLTRNNQINQFLPVPLTNDNAVTSLSFVTAAEQVVKITYNAECVVTGSQGGSVTMHILVDGIPAKPDHWVDGFFRLCSAVDATGKTWASVARQGVLKVPAGNHTVQIIAAQEGYMSYRLDDTSLVVEGLPRASATIDVGTNYGPGGPYDLLLKKNGATTLKFATKKDNQRVLATYNPNCNSGDVTIKSFIHVQGVASPDNVTKLLCPSLPNINFTWAATAIQKVFELPTAGEHLLGVTASASDYWSLRNASLVVDRSILASAWRNAAFESTSTSEVAVPLEQSGGNVLKFTTTTAKQPVIITYSAHCAIAAPRGTFVSIRIEVDGVEVNPASGHDFAFCSAVQPGHYTRWPGFRQSTIRVRTAGEHEVRIYARASAAANWALSGTWLVVR